MIGVFATPAPFIGKLVGPRVLRSMAAVSMLKKVRDPLRILSDIAGMEKGREEMPQRQMSNSPSF